MSKCKLVLTLIICLIATGLHAQEKDEIFYKVDQSANYPGGMGALYSFIGSKTKYTKEAKRAKIEGTVMVSIVIDKTGVVLSDSVRVIEGLGYGLDEEAIRVMKLLKRWTPARVTELDKNVSQRIVLPIKFQR